MPAESDAASWLEANRSWWDERVGAHAEGSFYDLQGLIAGRSDLRPWELAEVGPVEGKDLIHLQCHLGTDTIDWVRRGARVTGLDFSSRALNTLSMLGRWAGLELKTVEADVYNAVEAVGDARFDIVYTGVGALSWLPNLDRWADVVSRLLRPGGFLYLYEAHPTFLAMNDDGTGLADASIAAAFERNDKPEVGSYAAPTAEFEHHVTYERVHGLSELFTAVIDAGLSIELFNEFDRSSIPAPFLEQGDDGLYRLPPEAVRYPLSYSLRARKPS